VLGIVSAGIIAFALLTSNPFTRLTPAPLDGNDLNPLLQDPGMIIHPPMLYLGYVGMAVPFAFAVAALLTRRLDKDWAKWTRPWTVAAWVFLTGHVINGPLAFPMRARAITTIREVIGRADSTVPKTPEITDKIVVFANPPTDPLACYVPIIRASTGDADGALAALRRWVAATPCGTLGPTGALNWWWTDRRVRPELQQFVSRD